jgi:DNA-binding PadR family transcriptional regulator
MNDIFNNIFLAFVRVHLLHHAAQGRIYGVEMIEELARHGYRLSPGTLYPILHGLEEANYLTSEREVVGGKMRKYYRITRQGSRALTAIREKIGELVREVDKDKQALVSGPLARARRASRDGRSSDNRKLVHGQS